MQLKDIVKGTLKIGSLVLLLDIGINSYSNAQFGLFSDSPKKVAEKFFNAIKNEDIEDFKAVTSSRYLQIVRQGKHGEAGNLKRFHGHYNSKVTIENYISQEGEDRKDVVWASHEGCGYHQVILTEENEEWKVYTIGSFFKF